MGFMKKLFGSKENAAPVEVETPQVGIDIRKKVVDLSKKAKVQIDKKGLSGVKSQVVLVLDVSGSMRPLFNNGSVQKTVERLLALGMNFDDDGEIDVILFGNKHYQMTPVKIDNIHGYVKNEVLANHRINEGTEYAKPIRLIKDKYSNNKGDPVFVIFVTDGDNSDKPKTTELIKAISEESIFFQFVGIGGGSFPYLEKLDSLEGRFIDNAGFMKVQDISTMSEDALYSDLINEYPDWLKEAKAKNVI